LLFLINTLQYGRCREKFERAAHRKSLVRPIFNLLLLVVSSAATPIRPPIRASIAAIRVAASFSPATALAATKVNKRKPLTIDDKQDGLLSLRQKLPDTLRKLFRLR